MTQDDASGWKFRVSGTRLLLCTLHCSDRTYATATMAAIEGIELARPNAMTVQDAAISPGLLPTLATPKSFPFPYPRPYDIQLDLMRTVFQAIEERKIAIVCTFTASSLIYTVCVEMNAVADCWRSNRQRVPARV